MTEASPVLQERRPAGGPAAPWARLVLVWLTILPAIAFWLSYPEPADPVQFTVLPQVIRPGDPLSLSLQIHGSLYEAQEVEYEIYGNGELLQAGTASLAPGVTRRYTYLYPSSPERGQQANFLARVTAGGKQFSKSVALPPYPPQIWSSFVSFSSFSTSMMGSLATSELYRNSFGPGNGFNVGIATILSLFGLSLFLELTHPVAASGRQSLLAKLHLRFQELLVILLFAFCGIVYTIVVLAP